MKKTILGILLMACSCSRQPNVKVTTVKLMMINPINMGASGRIREHGVSIQPEYIIQMSKDSMIPFIKCSQKLQICDTCDGFHEPFEIKIQLNQLAVSVQGSKYGNIKSDLDLEKIDIRQIETLCYPYINHASMDIFSLYSARKASTYYCMHHRDSIKSIFSNLKKRAVEKESFAMNEWMGISFLSGKTEILYLSLSKYGFVSANHKFYKLDDRLWQLIKIHLPENVLKNLPYEYQKLSNCKK